MILIGGENLIDLIEQPPAADAAQPQRRVIHAVEGGSPYNTAIAAGRLGAEVGRRGTRRDRHLARRALRPDPPILKSTRPPVSSVELCEDVREQSPQPRHRSTTSSVRILSSRTPALRCSP